MAVNIPKWILAALVGAAPMLGIVFLILFSCTLLGLVQRCKIGLTKTCAKRKQNRHSIHSEDRQSIQLVTPTEIVWPSKNLIISPFDHIPMRDIDAESKDDVSSTSSKQFRRRSGPNSVNISDYDNPTSSIFDDNEFEHDRLSLIDTLQEQSKRRGGTKQTPPDTIIHV